MTSSSRKTPLTPFSPMNDSFILMIAILACIWYHVMGTKQVTWRHGKCPLEGRSGLHTLLCHAYHCAEPEFSCLHFASTGLYGRSYFLKPRQHGLHGDAVGMKETSPSRPENATAAA